MQRAKKELKEITHPVEVELERNNLKGTIKAYEKIKNNKKIDADALAALGKAIEVKKAEQKTEKEEK